MNGRISTQQSLRQTSVRAEASARYDAALAQHGRVVRIEPYAGNATKILHRCLLHGEEHLAYPSNASRGHGLRCCQKATNQATSAKKQAEAASVYDARLAQLGRIVRVEPYAGTDSTFLHRCLIHGEVHPCSPRAALRGQGLYCCRVAAAKTTAGRRLKRAAIKYDQTIKQFGRVERVEPYQGSIVPILHRCLIHGETHLSMPANCKKGLGLKCCWTATNQAGAASRMEKAASSYDAALARFGFMERLGDYLGAHTPILHRCLAHGEEQMARPTNCRRGRKLGCCRRAVSGHDSLENTLAGVQRCAAVEETGLYIYTLKNYPGFLKPGIAKDLDRRSAISDGEYGVLVAEWRRPSRTEAFLVEQALLKATRRQGQCPDELFRWPGASEVRRIDEAPLVELAQALIDELGFCANPWEFALAHRLLTAEQEPRAQALIQAGALSEAELGRRLDEG